MDNRFRTTDARSLQEPPDRDLIAELKAILADNDAAIAGLQSDNAEQRAEIARLNTHINKLDNEIERLRSGNALWKEIKQLRAAAIAFETGLSSDCDGPERDALRAALEFEP